jgi:cyclopropane fatty-acyl-phospholipid synthase-like methyltransferase
MPLTSPEPDRFPSSDFDQWAGQYDGDVLGVGFPFSGYQQVLAEVVQQAGATAGMTILDLGTGTGNLSELFNRLGCILFCTDFSGAMLKLARKKLPHAGFFLHDLREPFPSALMRRYDRIVSAYVFHHFELAEKVRIASRLMKDHLAVKGSLIIADVSFPTQAALEAVRRAAGEQWEEEPYWIAELALPALQSTGANVSYTQVSDCAGVYRLSRPGD